MRKKPVLAHTLSIPQTEVQVRPILEGRQNILSRKGKINFYQVNLYTCFSGNYLNPPLTRELREAVELL